MLVESLRRPAIEDIPADAGSIGHVADAASVRSGKFFSAARLINRIHNRIGGSGTIPSRQFLKPAMQLHAG